MRKQLATLSFAVLVLLFSTAKAQPINLDRPVKAGELTLFPDIGNENVYYYVSDKPKLSMLNGKPQFSFLRYVDNVVSGPDASATEGDGGGIVHAVVSLEVTQDQVREANRELQRIKPNARIEGPIVYRSGKFGIVSSFKDPQGGLVKQVVGLGNAPILDGQKAAVSIQLTKQGAKILWESFKTVAPDISFTFEMEMGGYRSPKRATIEANFDQVYQHTAFGVAVATTFLQAEINTAFDDLVRSGAIKVTQIGEDDKMEALITTAYNKITELMFTPLNGGGNPSVSDMASGGAGRSLLDRATTMLRENRTEARAINRENEERRRALAARRPTPADASGAFRPDARTGGATTEYEPSRAAREGGITPPERTDANGNSGAGIQDVALPTLAIVASFEMRRVRQQGIFKIDLNKSTADKISMRFDENIGNLTSYMNDVSVFRQVNLDDPLFVQREILAFVDGMNAQDFGQYINFVNVRLKKTHESGDVTNKEIRIDRNNFNKEGNNFKVVYGWKNDNERKKWLDYEYETEWSFFGGQTVKVPVTKSKSGAINLAPPFQRRTVEFQADQNNITTNNIRLLTVKLLYKVNNTEQNKVVTLSPSKGQLSEKIDFILPANSYDYEYEVTWKLGNNETKTSGKKKGNDAIVFVDTF